MNRRSLGENWIARDFWHGHRKNPVAGEEDAVLETLARILPNPHWGDLSLHQQPIDKQNKKLGLNILSRALVSGETQRKTKCP